MLPADTPFRLLATATLTLDPDGGWLVDAEPPADTTLVHLPAAHALAPSLEELEMPLRRLGPGQHRVRYGRAPARFQRSRQKGARRTEGAVYVGRRTAWGNPFIVREQPRGGVFVVLEHGNRHLFTDQAKAHAKAVALALPVFAAKAILVQKALRGRDVDCWCRLCPAHALTGLPLGTVCAACLPCHGDVLLAVANGPLRCEAM